MDNSQPIQDHARMFWRRLESEPETLRDILTSCSKYMTVTGFPSDLRDDFIQTLLCVCAERYINYDESLSSLKTWVIGWARALMRAYHRRDRGKLNPMSYDDLADDDDLSIITPSGQAIDLDSAIDRVPDERATVELSDEFVAVRDVIRCYVQGTSSDYADHSAIAVTLAECGFDASVQFLSDATGLSIGRVRRIREEVMLDLRVMLMQRGIEG